MSAEPEETGTGWDYTPPTEVLLIQLSHLARAKLRTSEEIGLSPKALARLFRLRLVDAEPMLSPRGTLVLGFRLSAEGIRFQEGRVRPYGMFQGRKP